MRIAMALIEIHNDLITKPLRQRAIRLLGAQVSPRDNQQQAFDINPAFSEFEVACCDSV